METLLKVLVLVLLGVSVLAQQKPVMNNTFMASGEVEHHLAEETRFGTCEQLHTRRGSLARADPCRQGVGGHCHSP